MIAVRGNTSSLLYLPTVSDAVGVRKAVLNSRRRRLTWFGSECNDNEREEGTVQDGGWSDQSVQTDMMKRSSVCVYSRTCTLLSLSSQLI